MTEKSEHAAQAHIQLIKLSDDLLVLIASSTWTVTQPDVLVMKCRGKAALQSFYYPL